MRREPKYILDEPPATTGIVFFGRPIELALSHDSIGWSLNTLTGDDLRLRIKFVRPWGLLNETSVFAQLWTPAGTINTGNIDHGTAQQAVSEIERLVVYASEYLTELMRPPNLMTELELCNTAIHD